MKNNSCRLWKNLKVLIKNDERNVKSEIMFNGELYQEK